MPKQPVIQREYTEAELLQLRAIIKNIHITLNTAGPGTRQLLAVHGFSPGKFQGLKRGTYKLMFALERILRPEAPR